MPVPPEPEPDADLELVLEAERRATGDPDWCGDEGDEMVSVRVAQAACIYRELLQAASVYAMADRLGPALAGITSAAEVRKALYAGLDDAARAVESEWRRRYPR